MVTPKSERVKPLRNFCCVLEILFKGSLPLRLSCYQSNNLKNNPKYSISLTISWTILNFNIRHANLDPSSSYSTNLYSSNHSVSLSLSWINLVTSNCWGKDSAQSTSKTTHNHSVIGHFVLEHSRQQEERKVILISSYLSPALVRLNCSAMIQVNVGPTRAPGANSSRSPPTHKSMFDGC